MKHFIQTVAKARNKEKVLQGMQGNHDAREVLQIHM